MKKKVSESLADSLGCPICGYKNGHIHGDGDLV